MAELTPQQKAEMSKNKELSTQLMQVIRDLTVSGGSSELIDKLSTLQNQYAKRAELPSTQQFRSLQMGEETPPAHTVPKVTQSDAVKMLQQLQPHLETLAQPGFQSPAGRPATPEEMEKASKFLRDSLDQLRSISEASLPDLPPSDPAQEQQIEDASAAYKETLRRITQPGGRESLSPEQKAAAVKIAEGKL